MSTMSNITVNVPNEFKIAVRVAAAQQDMSISDFTRAALRMLLKMSQENSESTMRESRTEYDVK